MSGNKIVGISRGTFVVGLVFVLAISMVFSVLVIKEGPQGIQGVQGERGPQGNQGPQGVKGNAGRDGVDGTDGKDGVDLEVLADVSALVNVWFTEILLGEDKHEVEGFIMNFGTESAYNVVLDLTWNLGGGKYVYKTISLGTLYGHEIQEINATYHFEGKGTYSYNITWD